MATNKGDNEKCFKIRVKKDVDESNGKKKKKIYSKRFSFKSVRKMSQRENGNKVGKRNDRWTI